MLMVIHVSARVLKRTNLIFVALCEKLSPFGFILLASCEEFGPLRFMLIGLKSESFCLFRQRRPGFIRSI